MEIVKSIRTIRLDNKIPFRDALEITLVTTTLKDQMEKDLPIIRAMCNLSTVKITDKLPQGAVFKNYPFASLPSSGSTLLFHLNTSGLVSEKRIQLEKELQNIEGQIERLEKLLNSDFAQKAPAAVVQKEREKLTAFQETAEKLKTQINTL